MILDRSVLSVMVFGAMLGGTALADEAGLGKAPVIPTTSDSISAGAEPETLKLAQVEWKKAIAKVSETSTKVMLTAADEPAFLRQLRIDGSPAPTTTTPNAMLASQPAMTNLKLSPQLAKKYGEALQQQIELFDIRQRAMQATIEVEDFED